MKLTELSGKVALKAIEDMFDGYRDQIHTLRLQVDKLELKIKSLEKVKKEKSATKTFEGYVSEWKKLYYWVDIEKELAKMDGWLRLHPERKKTPRFCVNWFNKYCGEKPFDQPKSKPLHPSHAPTPIIPKEVDVEWEKKIALWDNLPDEERHRRIEDARKSFNNPLFANAISLKTKAINSL